MRNYTGNLLQFSESLSNNVTNKIQKNWHNIGSRFDFRLRFFLKVIFLEGVSLCKIKFHKSVDILLIYSWVIYLMHSSASQLQLIKHFQYSVSCFNNTHTQNSIRGKVVCFHLLWVIIRCLNQQESSPFDDPAPPEDAKIILRAFLFYGNSPRWNPHWGSDGTYLSKGFLTSASTRRVRRRDAATFD